MCTLLSFKNDNNRKGLERLVQTIISQRTHGCAVGKAFEMMLKLFLFVMFHKHVGTTLIFVKSTLSLQVSWFIVTNIFIE